MHYKIVLIAIIHRKNSKEILLVRRKREPGVNMWSLPGGIGALKSEKNPFKAILNEVFHDFSVTYKANFYTLNYEHGNEPTLHLYFQGEIIGKPKIRKNSKTVKEIKWFPVKDILNTRLAFEEIDRPSLQSFIHDQSKY